MPMPPDHPLVPKPKLGLLLINLGTPDALDYWSMRRYLGEFLSDKRVVELPKILWQLILQGPILTFRPKKSAAAYRQVWNNKLDESPLRTITAKTESLQSVLEIPYSYLRCVMVTVNPVINQMFDDVVENCVFRFTHMPQVRRVSADRHIRPCAGNHDGFSTVYDDPEYIQVCEISKQQIASRRGPDVLVASFHGVPKEYLIKGNPYPQCQKTDDF